MNSKVAAALISAGVMVSLNGQTLFDFENAAVHSPLPLSLTVDGLTAQFSATGQGFSIQPADTMGFTPLGFSGNCIYPNSVFASDLNISFSESLSQLSILYAPQELACDSSARMRVTAFMDSAEAGTATMTADPPGTWPTATLAISVPSGFNKVVVHYDAPPPTGGDWGPIFMADNLAVSIVPEPGTLSLVALGVLGIYLRYKITQSSGKEGAQPAILTESHLVKAKHCRYIQANARKQRFYTPTAEPVSAKGAEPPTDGTFRVDGPF